MRRSFGNLRVVAWISTLALPLGAAPSDRAGCPAEMVRVQNFCIDRWESSLVTRARDQTLSPYYPPQPAFLARIFSVWQVERKQIGSAAARDMPLPLVPTHQRGAYD